MSDRTLGILFALATATFWGVYGPALGFARSSSSPPLWSPFKPYVFIGVAYLVWGVLGGLVAMKFIPAKPDNLSFTGTYLPAMKWGFLAGSLGAFGALTLTFAMFKAKNAGLVMPIVFGGAVTVTAITNYVIITMIQKHQVDISPMLWVGVALVAAGIVLVAKHTPHMGHAPASGGAAHAAPAAPVEPAGKST